MQVILIEPLLKNQSGHQFSNTVALQSELLERDIPVFILGNISADQQCLKVKNFYPCLTEITSDLFQNGFSLKNIFNAYNKIRLLGEQLDNFFQAQINLNSQKDYLFFLHSVYIFELLGFALFFKKRKNIFIDNNHKAVVSFNFEFKRKPLFLKLIFSFLYKYLFSSLIKGADSQIIYSSDGELLARDYEQLMKKKVHVLPPPSSNKFLEAWLKKANINSDKEKKVISYLGGARFNKGFDIFVRLLGLLLKDEKISKSISILAQVDIHRQQSERDKKIMLESAARLEDLSLEFKNIKLYFGALSMDEYFGLLSESDIVVLPYRRQSFQSTPSGIFREAVYLRKLPIVAGNTAMSHELEGYGLADLAFNIEDLEDCVHVIKKAVENFDNYQAKIENMRLAWSDYYSAGTLADRLIDLAR